jgi:hypothetical protein
MSSLFAIVTSLAAAQHNLPQRVIGGDVYSATPAGWVLANCITETSDLTGANAVRPPCVARVNASNPVLRSNTEAAEAATAPVGPDVQGLPADYDGWLQYTAFQTEAGFSSFTGLMSVPDTPVKLPQILYLFPGLQNIDWIPKVDPEPSRSNPFDIIQPVLQYPGQKDGTWGLRSWYVTVNEGAAMSEMLDISPGDAVLCNMTQLGEIDWFVGSKIVSSGKETNTRITKLRPGAAARLLKQPWAYNTLECYGCDGCDTFPKTPVTFSELKLVGTNGASINATWLPNPKPAKDLQCNEATRINGPDNVVISFR